MAAVGDDGFEEGGVPAGEVEAEDGSEDAEDEKELSF